MVKIDFKTPIGRIFIYVAAGAILLAAVYIVLRETPDEIVYKGKIRFAVHREKIAALKEEARVIQKEKDKLLSEIADLGNQIVQTPAPEKIQTIEVKKIEYVPKIQYVQLWKNAGFSQEIIEKYTRYVFRDKELMEVNASTASTYESQIIDMQQTIDRLYKISKRKIHLSVGLVAGVGPRGWFAGAGIGLMYTIR